MSVHNLIEDAAGQQGVHSEHEPSPGNGNVERNR